MTNYEHIKNMTIKERAIYLSVDDIDSARIGKLSIKEMAEDLNICPELLEFGYICEYKESNKYQCPKCCLDFLEREVTTT